MILANGGSLNTLGGRAELLAAVEALRLCGKATQQVIIWSDCLFVISGFARGRRRKHLSLADLWEDFWKAHDVIDPPPVLFHKVWRSHATEAGNRCRAHITTGSIRQRGCRQTGRERSIAERRLRGICCCNPQHRVSRQTCSNQVGRDQPDRRPEQTQNCSC